MATFPPIMEIRSTYSPPPLENSPEQLTKKRMSQSFDTCEDVQEYDANGHRAPYRIGPYDYHHDEDGRLIKKRWCK
jgi:hypothetical protein